MKKLITIGIILTAVFAVFLLVRKEGAREPEKIVPASVVGKTQHEQKNTTLPKPMHISSPAFENNGRIPFQYTCDGENTNPPFTISDIPSGTKSLALIVDDPDAPGGEWVHWTAWNIDPTIKEIAKNTVPAGAIEGKTDFKKPGYGGPCPPDGTHRYFFKLYALDAKLDLQLSATKMNLEKAMRGHILDQTQLIGLYGRSY